VSRKSVCQRATGDIQYSRFLRLVRVLPILDIDTVKRDIRICVRYIDRHPNTSVYLSEVFDLAAPLFFGADLAAGSVSSAFLLTAGAGAGSSMRTASASLSNTAISFLS